MSYPLTYRVEHPEKLSRLLLIIRILFGWLYVGIPHGIILWLYGIVVGIAQFLAFFAVLFAGKYPKGLFDFVVGYMRWYNRVIVYMAFMRDEYPPFNGQE
jgi:hypothetical protein